MARWKFPSEGYIPDIILGVDVAAANHEDVHLWYQGTIDPTTSTVSDGVATLNHPDTDGWYLGPDSASSSNPPRWEGYGLSRIGGLDRLTYAPDGVSRYLGGSGSRVTVSDRSQAVWPNVISLTTDDKVTAAGQLSLNYYHENDGGSATTTFFLDPERTIAGNWYPDGNPYNQAAIKIGNQPQKEPRTSQTPSALESLTIAIPPSVGAGEYQLYAEIQDTINGVTYTRYDYAPGVVTIRRPSATVVTPSGPQSGNVTIKYSLFDPQSDRCSILVQYSPNGGRTWNTATAVSGQGDGTTGLTSSPSGRAHTYVWASGSDIGNVNDSNVEIRITPSDAGGVDTAGTSSVFTVNNHVTPPTVMNVLGQNQSTGSVGAWLVQNPPLGQAEWVRFGEADSTKWEIASVPWAQGGSPLPAASVVTGLVTAPSQNNQPLQAVDPRVVDRMDLLTVVEHELGHIAGLNDLDALTDDVMSGVLGSGIGRNASHLDAVLASL